MNAITITPAPESFIGFEAIESLKRTIDRERSEKERVQHLFKTFSTRKEERIKQLEMEVESLQNTVKTLENREVVFPKPKHRYMNTVERIYEQPAADIEELRRLLLEKMGIVIVTPSHCKMISAEIHRALGVEVSETTLKRLFGFACVKHDFSKFTISTILEFINQSLNKAYTLNGEPLLEIKDKVGIIRDKRAKPGYTGIQELSLEEYEMVEIDLNHRWRMEFLRDLAFVYGKDLAKFTLKVKQFKLLNT